MALYRGLGGGIKFLWIRITFWRVSFLYVIDKLLIVKSRQFNKFSADSDSLTVIVRYPQVSIYNVAKTLKRLCYGWELRYEIIGHFNLCILWCAKSQNFCIHSAYKYIKYLVKVGDKIIKNFQSVDLLFALHKNIEKYELFPSWIVLLCYLLYSVKILTCRNSFVFCVFVSNLYDSIL